MELTLGCLTWQAKGVSQFQCRDLKEHSRLGVELFMYDRSNVNRKGRTGSGFQQLSGSWIKAAKHIATE